MHCGSSRCTNILLLLTIVLLLLLLVSLLVSTVSALSTVRLLLLLLVVALLTLSLVILTRLWLLSGCSTSGECTWVEGGRTSREATGRESLTVGVHLCTELR